MSDEVGTLCHIVFMLESRWHRLHHPQICYHSSIRVDHESFQIQIISPINICREWSLSFISQIIVTWALYDSDLIKSLIPPITLTVRSILC